MRHHDLIIIGSGSGNSLVTAELEALDIAIVEAATFGGTCLNAGCIPTKMFVYAADVATSIRTASRYGVDAHLDGVRWRDIRDRVFGRIDPISAGGRAYRAEGPHTTLYQARAKFTGPRTLSLSTGEELTAERIVIAAGSRASVPDAVTASGVAYHTSDDVMRIEELPERMVILGCGYIGSEFAHVFSSLGVDVTVVARSGLLLRQLDAEVSARFTALAAQRWDVRLHAKVGEVSERDGEISVGLSDGTTIPTDALLVATGRITNADLLDPDAAGLRLTDDGRIWADEYQRTSVEGIWTLGDVSSPYQLKHVANHEARVVAHNLARPDDLRRSDHRFVPSAVFTDPQIASVGLTEDEARERGLDAVIARQDFGGSAYGWAMEDTTSFCKLIAERGSGLLLGAHLMGPQASTLIQPLIQAMSFGQSVRGLARGQYWIHPALTEVVENALLKLDID